MSLRATSTSFTPMVGMPFQIVTATDDLMLCFNMLLSLQHQKAATDILTLTLTLAIALNLCTPLSM